jgi:hypothetical protein
MTKLFLALACATALSVSDDAADRSEAAGDWFAVLQRIETEAGIPLRASTTLDTGLRGAASPARMTLAGLDVFYADPMSLPVAARRITNALVACRGNAVELSHHAFTLIGSPAGGYGPPVRGSISGASAIAPAAEIEQTLNLLGRSTAQGGIGLNLSPEDRKAWRQLDPNVSRLTLSLLLSCANVLPAIDGFVDRSAIAAEATLPLDAATGETASRLGTPWETRDLSEPLPCRSFEFAEWRLLAYGTRLLLEGMNAAVKSYGEVAAGTAIVPGGVRFDCELGPIGVFGAGDDSVSGDYFLVVDLGGDDRYEGRVASSLGLTRPLGLLIDLGGNDVYGSFELQNAPACGVLGVGALWDLAGDDVYRCGGSGIASALGGAAVLIDSNGNDTYESRGRNSQGAATAGIALLIDDGGDDLYESADRSQGFGATLGSGLLIDLQGRDRYVGAAATGESKRPANFVQGAGVGLWHEAADGVNLGGGIGVLLDAAGNDSYSAGSFAQGAAYYRGFGICSDLAGADEYEARSYSRGAAAHYGLAVFCDGAGDDRYDLGAAPNHPVQSLGHGHDLSAGFFIDAGGDDKYMLGSRCAGSAELEAVGVFWEAGGDDSYDIAVSKDSGRTCLGRANSLAGISTGFRPYQATTLWSIAVFIDTQGVDSYKNAKLKDGEVVLKREGPNLLGIAVDTELGPGILSE